MLVVFVFFLVLFGVFRALPDDAGLLVTAVICVPVDSVGVVVDAGGRLAGGCFKFPTFRAVIMAFASVSFPFSIKCKLSL